ncbi:MAG: thermonuclease family protein [Candidatus Obscuribacterales bacterium]|nr:thermonuclease family protein [Candidatus Obscuribacterales bacterium]
MANQQLIRIRLAKIDCPEKHQPFGQKAKQFTSSLSYNKTVTLKEHGKDRYGRTIGTVLLPDGRSLNKELVRTGLAWWYSKYAPNDTELDQLQLQARETKKGLWSDSNPIPPWEFRKQEKHDKYSTAHPTLPKPGPASPE